MNNKIEVKEVIKIKNRIEIKFNVEGRIKKYFREKLFFSEYSEDIENIPEGIAIIPFLGDILPLVWMTDSELVINELDKSYYECLSKVKEAYSNMYCGVDFLGKIIVKKVVENSYIPNKKVCQLFSGGVDSVATYVNIKDKLPELVTIWGSDISINNNIGWKKLEKTVKEFGKNNKNKNIIIKSNFRKIYSSHKLTKDFIKKIKTDWWLGIQHGIALISLVIPYTYQNKIPIIYVPASFNVGDKEVRCASYPTIDESIKYANGKVIHEGFDSTRQDKILSISKYIKKTNDKNIRLKVCWEGDNGGNCSHCEKCLRTIVGLYLGEINPNEVGFSIEKEKIKEIIYNNDIELQIDDWKDLQNFLLKNKEIFIKEKWINWLIELDIEKYNNNLLKNKAKLLYKLRAKIKKIFIKND